MFAADALGVRFDTSSVIGVTVSFRTGASDMEYSPITFYHPIVMDHRSSFLRRATTDSEHPLIVSSISIDSICRSFRFLPHKQHAGPIHHMHNKKSDHVGKLVVGLRVDAGWRRDTIESGERRLVLVFRRDIVLYAPFYIFFNRLHAGCAWTGMASDDYNIIALYVCTLALLSQDTPRIWSAQVTRRPGVKIYDIGALW